MSIVTKQLIINEIRLPMDMINIIKEYCFYNIEEVVKRNKLKVCRVIDSVEFSRANGFNNDPYWAEGEEKWKFAYAYQSILGEKLHIEAANCLNCGNYIQTFNLWLPTSALCKCYQLDDDFGGYDLNDDNVSENSDEWMNIY